MNNTIHRQSLRMIVCALAGVSLAFAALLRHTGAQSGALIPVSVKNEPDSSILSLQAMKVDVTIDNQHARVKVFPIPAYGSKRVELEYTEMLPVENPASHFNLPLRPSYGQPQRVGELRINVQALSDSPISPLSFRSMDYAMQAVKTEPNDRSAFSAAMPAAGCAKKWR